MIVVQGVVFLKSNEHCRPHGHHQKVGGEEAGVAHHEEESRLASQAEVRQSGQKWTAKQEQGKKADAAVLGCARFVDTPFCPSASCSSMSSTGEL